MGDTLPIVLAILSLVISTILAVVVFDVVRRDRSSEKDLIQELSPALMEAEKVSREIGPLLTQVENLKEVLLQGTVQYETRIEQLKTEIDKFKETRTS